jgi:tetratricopeptide (TPR) repeat protein
MRILKTLCLLLGMISAHPVGHADEIAPAQRAKAKARIKKARGHYEAGQYDQAIAEYQTAYTLTPMAEILFNIGQIERVKGDKPAAVAWYRKYLSESPGGRMAGEATIQIAALTREQVPEALGDRWDQDKAALAALDADKRVGLDEKWAAIEERVGSGETRNLAMALDSFEQALRRGPRPGPSIAPESEQRAVARAAQRTRPTPWVPNPMVKKWWFWTALGGGAAVALAIGLGAGLSGASDPVPTLGTLR